MDDIIKLKNPINVDILTIEKYAKYYALVSDDLERILDVISYIWCKKNKSQSIEKAKLRFDSILEKIVYASSYYDELSQALMQYIDVVNKYKQQIDLIIKQFYNNELNMLHIVNHDFYKELKRNLLIKVNHNIAKNYEQFYYESSQLFYGFAIRMNIYFENASF